MQNQLDCELILARARALARMQRRRIIAKHQILDNQASVEYKTAIEASGMTYKLVPPEEHQRNMAEKAIQTFKDHFIGVLSGCAPSMQIHLWCQLLAQVKWQLLLLRQSWVHLNVSGYVHVYNQHGYNQYSFSPWAWKHWSMTNPTSAAPTPNTAPKVLSWAHPPNTIHVGNFGPPL